MGIGIGLGTVIGQWVSQPKINLIRVGPTTSHWSDMFNHNPTPFTDWE